MRLCLKPYQLPLKHTFSISRESVAIQDSLIACLSLHGETGYGEATANPYYCSSLEGMQKEIYALQQEIENWDFELPETFHQFLQECGLSNFSLCALDLAAHDLFGKLLGKPLYEIWGTTNSNYPITNYTIGLDTVEKMVEKLLEKPWPLYKIKLGTQEDIPLLRELRKHTNSPFRVDANGAWTADEAHSKSGELAALGVEFLEQPLKASDRAGMEYLKQVSVIPLIADESCVGEDDVDRCAGLFDGINIKLTKCGGLTPALRMIRRGRELGLKIMVGCMTESTVGISAIAQLAPQLDYVDMDGAMLLERDIAMGVRIKDNGLLVFPDKGGSGVSLLE